MVRPDGREGGGGEKFSWSAYLLNVPRGLVNFLPWVVLLPLAWRSWPDADLERAGAEANTLAARTPYPGTISIPSMLLDFAVARGLRWSLAGCFLVVSVAPGSLPRYTLPLLVPACVLLALTFTRLLPRDPRPLPAWVPLAWERVIAVCLILVILTAPAAAYFGGRKAGVRWLAALAVVTASVYLLRRLHRLRLLADGATLAAPGPRVLPLALASGVVMALFTANYAVGAMHRLHRNENVRPDGTEIRRLVPAGQQVAVLRPGFLPFLFYIDGLLYLQSIDTLAPSIHFLLVRQDELAAAETSLIKQGLTQRILFQARDKRIADAPHGTWLLLSLDPSGEPSL